MLGSILIAMLITLGIGLRYQRQIAQDIAELRVLQRSLKRSNREKNTDVWVIEG